MSTSWVFAFAAVTFLFCGCTKTVQHRVAGYYPGLAPTTQPVPKTAVYSVRFIDEKGNKTGGVALSHRYLPAGEHAGFDIDEDQGICAVAGRSRFAITIPDGYGAIWSTTYHERTQFAKEVSKTAKAAGNGLSKTAQAAVKVTGYIAKGIVESQLDGGDDDDDWQTDSNRAEDRIYERRQREDRLQTWRYHKK